MERQDDGPRPHAQDGGGLSEERIPLVPPEVDLRDFREMPLEFERLFASDTWVLGTPEEKVAAFHLWCKSWHQQPAGSLPDDDRILAHLSGSGVRWKKLRAHALRGWEKCSDGRFYHPVVAEKACRAWKVKVEQRLRTFNARCAAIRKRLADATGQERDQLQGQLDALLRDAPKAVTGTNRREGKGVEGKGGEGNREALDLSAASRRRAESDGRTVETWNRYSAAYETRYSVPPVRNRQVNGMLAKLVDKLGAEEAPQVAAFYVGHDKGLYVSSRHCVDLLLRDAEGLRTEWATGRKGTEHEARQADRSAGRGNAVVDLLEQSRKVHG